MPSQRSCENSSFWQTRCSRTAENGSRPCLDQHGYSSGEALCTILDDEMLKSETVAATQLSKNLGSRAILLVDGLSAPQPPADYTTLTKPFTGADLLGVINSLIEAAK
ncbi:transcriptional regulator [Sinorhizobium medicae]|uniref:Transcriptional regulator n=3 Tax=Sinorhizobium medicae TaxID=110321 RepID=A0ABX4TKD9_9HYPH|nr:transcriptional regulator [Sinorhizobium medicae]PND17748.1 transcriptional regulator [Ensifer sp. MMN_5]MDX0522049.1 transcriptional regulator [Sinorhizobium medicae]MDX0633866.1 transcriptional regulator [Sinorhizobium medicae]MDX0694275.1 transcriptional regulator [Sinorhizobium medicae]